jgi:hypothetical protein
MARGQGCTSRWLETFRPRSFAALSNTPFPSVRTSVVFDADGAGPGPAALYIGGTFTSMGGEPAFAVARWDGHRWNRMGRGLYGIVGSLLVFDDDGAGPHLPALYALGRFRVDDGGPRVDVAKWDGQAWFTVAGGLPPLGPACQERDGRG